MARSILRAPYLLAASIHLLASVPATGGPALFRGANLFDVSDWPAGQGGQPFAAAAGDMNNDGWPDLVVANFADDANVPGNGNRVNVLLTMPNHKLQPLFYSSKSYVTGIGPNGVAIADFNKDKRLDVVTANPGNGAPSISILLGDGSGALPTHTDLPFAQIEGCVRVGDLNQDGNTDIVAGVIAPPGVLVLLGTGTGTFIAGPVVATGASALAGLVVGDVTGDAHPDVVTADGAANTVTVLRGDGAGGLVPIGSFATGNNPQDVEIGLLDADANPDLAVATQDAPSVSVLFGTGGGSFGAFTTLFIGVTHPWSVALADMGGDGRVDLALTCDATGFGSVNTVALIRNRGNGTFDPVRLYGGGPGPGEIVLADFNQDGAPDVAAPTRGSPSVASMTHSVAALLNDGSGMLLSTIDSPIQDQMDFPAIADFDRNGKADIAVCENFLNVYTGTGLGTFSQVSSNNILLPRKAVATDLNRDGKVDLVAQNGSEIDYLQGNGDGTFQVPVAKVVNHVLAMRSVADMNRDGSPDLVLIFSNQVKVYVQGAGVTFSLAGIGTAAGPIAALEIADWNRDGKLDVAAATDAGVSVFSGDGTGALGAPLTIAGTGYTALCVADFNRDGKPDLVCRKNNQASGVTLLAGDGTGSFATVASLRPLSPRGYGVGSWDVNRDGRPDIVAMSQQVSGAPTNDNPLSLGVWLSDANGQFVSWHDYVAGSVDPTTNGIAGFADLNGDLAPDVVASAYDQAGFVTHVSISALLATPDPQDSTLDSRTDYACGADPEDVAVGDLNRDGKLDFVATSTDSGRVCVRLGVGDGTFGAAMNVTQARGCIRARLGDFDRNGILDLALLEPATQTVAVLLGVGNGTFGPLTPFFAGPGTDLEVADMDRDGNLDLIVPNNVGSVRVFRGTASGIFLGPLTSPILGVLSDIAIDDMNRDGKLDIVGANGKVEYLVGAGNGQFGPGVQTTVDPGNNAQVVAVVDFNGDGILDVAVPPSGASPFTLNALLGDGTGAFPTKVGTTAQFHAHSVTAGHAEGDGDWYLYMGVGLDSLAVMKHASFGFFDQATIYLTANGPRAVALGDFNRDALPDVAVAGSAANVVAIHLHDRNLVTTGVQTVAAGSPTPRAPRLAQNYPNPFNPETTIRFTTDRETRVRLAVFDVRGRIVATLLEGRLPPGEHRVRWTGTDEQGEPVASGIYFYRLSTDEGTANSRKMVLMK
jgi:hypothetical protein